uniref:BHLH domain-containing protein n=1 Tax=Clastoptera arizonana TaxID=38151 RepID=A0A1B6EG84_9HEMI
MMPKTFSDWDFEFNLDDEASMDAIDFYSMAGPDDDLWKKMDMRLFGDPLKYEETEVDQLYNSAVNNVLNSVPREIRNHDCMWTGHCLSKEHSRTHSPSPFIPVVPQIQQQPKVNNAPLINNHKPPLKTVSCTNSEKKSDVLCNVITNSKRTGVIVQKTVGRSLLLNSRTTQNNASSPISKQEFPPVKQELPVVVKQEFPISVKQELSSVLKQEFHMPHIHSHSESPRPLTPQSLSDDDPHSDHNNSVFRNALDVMLSQTAERGDWEEELMLNFGAQKSKVKPEIKAEPYDEDQRVNTVTHYDHNYDVTNKQGVVVKMEGLGVQTPSDSEEEEIDVVTLTERSTPSSRSSSISSCAGFSLPNNPSVEDQEELEEITTSKLLSASKAVSRKLKSSTKRSPYSRVFLTKKPVKRVRALSDSYDEDDDDDYEPIHFQPPKKYKTNSGKKRSKFSDNEPDSKEKRDLHNNMERMRRVDLRNSFEELRVLVPSLIQKERAAKVVILKEAAGYCCDLGTQSRLMSMQVTALRREQMRLRGVVSGLRKAAAVVVQKGKKCSKSKEKLDV